ncbi:MAG: hypothetical protein HKN35_09745 [Woeseia sp.]|nr:hypothetical protein [Woeseia sp.]NNE61167.1 hypothetical protein [Woeseia sp.]
MSIFELWLPIVVSSGLVWIASALIWTVLPWHKSDFSKVIDEEGARAGLKGLAPGQYMLPYCIDPKEIENPELRKKFEEGPVVYLTAMPNGVPQMGGRVAKSFVYNLVVGTLCAYLLTRTMMMADYLSVFQLTGTVAFAAYGFAYIQESIWFGRPWSTTGKSFLDALIYSLLTGGVFGWLAI